MLRQHTNKAVATTGGQRADVQKLLTVTEVAAILGLSRVKVFALLKQRPNGLPSVKIGGARRIQPNKLQAWIEQHAEEAEELPFLVVGHEWSSQATHFVGKGILNHELTH